MTEMNELAHTIDRVEQLLNQGEVSGALTCLEYVRNHALTAVKLIKDQAALLTKQQLEIITLNKDVEIQKERTAYWEKRDKTHEAEIKELDEQEPAIFQYRAYPEWQGQKGWDKWSGCTKDQFDDYVKTPVNSNWCYETRVLYARPVPAKRVPDGFAIVPINPSDIQQIAGGRDGHFCLCCGYDNGGGDPKLVYDAMISAANQGE